MKISNNIKLISGLGFLSLLALTSCSVERIDRCKTTATACPGLLGAPSAVTLVSLTPTSQSVSTLPTSVVAKFSEAVTALDASKFVITGTCANLPAVSSVVMNTESTEATANLSGGVCQNAQTFTVTVTPASITNVAGEAGEGSALSSTFTMVSLGPTAALATPSAVRLRSSTSATIALTYTGATATTLTNVGITKNETGVSCTVNVSGATASGATLTVTGCSGDGTITVSVNAGTASDASGNLSSASPASAVITVDNTGPSLTTLTPATATMVAAPTSVVATFSEAMTTLTNAKFVLSGTCSVLPTVSGVTMSAGNTVATAALSGGTCNDTQTLIVTVTPSGVTDTLGNAGTGGAQSRTYTVSTSGPTATLAAPSATRINSAGSSTVALTYNGAVATTLTSTGVSKTEVGTSCNVGVTGATAAGATLTVSGCTGSGTITVRVNANTATDSLGNGSSASAASSTITVDNTAPTLSSLTPGSASRTTMPSAVVATFSEAMSTIAPSQFVVSGTCSVLPTVTGVVMSSGNTIATASLSAATCTLSQTLTVSINPTAVTDLAGNSGTGSVTAVTYTKINGTGVLTIAQSGNMGDTSCGSVTRIFTVANTGNADADIATVSQGTGAMNLVGEDCTGVTLTPGQSCSVEIEAPAITPANDSIIVDYFNQQINTNVIKTLTSVAPGC